MKTVDVTALGELLVDFTENGMSRQGNPLLEANPGGAPCNVLAMLARLGRRTAFIGKVGDDAFGRRLKQAAEEAGIDTRNLLLDGSVHTTLAFVHRKADGDRVFSFYRDPGADMMLRADEIREDLIAGSRFFHFGLLSMTHSSVRDATRFALELAKKHGCIISFDPNLREPLWNSLEEARAQIAYGMAQCDVLKISDNELQWFTGEDDFDAGAAQLQSLYRIPLILVSRGRNGSSAYHKGMRIDAAPFLQANTIDTTGAGGTFCACVLHFLLERDFRDLCSEELTEMLDFANAAASLVTTRKGAMCVMPSWEEVETLLAAR